MALSTEQKARRLAANDGFQAKVAKALYAAATDVKGEAAILNVGGVGLSGGTKVSDYSRKRAALASQILNDVSPLVLKVGNLVAAQAGIATLLEPVTIDEEDAGTGDKLDEAIDYGDVAFTVNALFNDIAGIDSWDTQDAPTGAVLTAAYANDPIFQDRVYQIGAGLANSLLVAAPPAAEASDAVKAIDGVKRIFALKYQAGRYIGIAYKLNYAVNVLASPDLEGKTPDEITDAEILARLAELVEIFAQSMASFKAAGIDTGLLS